MSNPLYNPYASGNPSSSRGQYGLSGMQPERDPRSGPSRPGPEFSSPGVPSANTDSLGGIPTLMSQSPKYRPEQSRALMEQDLERSIDMHISRAREEVRLLNKALPMDQGTRFGGTQREVFESSGTGRASYTMPSPSAPHGQRHSDIHSGSSSMDWSSSYKRPTADDPPKFYSSSASLNYDGRGDSRFLGSAERERVTQSSVPAPGQHAASTEPSQPKYTSESAANILLHFGLEKDDLEHLISYPEDQITPDNLPFILRQIRIQKAKKTTTAVQSKPYPEPQPTRSMSGMDSHSLPSSTWAGVRQGETSSAVVQPSKVIDYGHTGKYTGAVGSDIGRTSGSGGSGSKLLMGTFEGSRQSQEQHQKHPMEVKSSDRGRSPPSLSSVFSSGLSSVPPQTNNPSKMLPTQQNPSSQSILSTFSLPKKDTDIRGLTSKASKPIVLKVTGVKVAADRQPMSTTQPPPILYRSVHPSRPGLVVIGSNEPSVSPHPGSVQGSTVPDQRKLYQTHQQPMHQIQPGQQMQPMHQIQAGQQKQPQPQIQPAQQKQPMHQTQAGKPKQMMPQKQPVQPKQTVPQTQQQSKQHKRQAQKQPASQTVQAVWPLVFPAAKSVPSASFIPGITDEPPPPGITVEPLPPGQQNLTNLPSKRPPPKKTTASFKTLPTKTMMQDYAAASPRIFPHTCTLCNKEFTHMKDWITHQNTSLHLKNCKRLRERYPDWDGEIELGPRPEGKETKPSPAASSLTYQQQQQKKRRDSRSCSSSPSPSRHYGPDGRWERRSRSRSRSPKSSRYNRRSRSRSPRYGRHRSRSRERRVSPWSRDDRRCPPRRNDRRPESPGRTHKRRPSPKRSRERRPSPRRSRESRSSSESSPRRRKSSSAERLAKKLLETSAVQSLATQSDLETVVKTLAPALLAELAKMKSSSSSPSSSSKGAKSSSSSSSAAAAASSSSTAVKAKPSQKKTESASSLKNVSIAKIPQNVSKEDVVDALKHFGKINHVGFLKFGKGLVCFDKEEDAMKMRSLDNFEVKRVKIQIKKENVTVQPKKPPQKIPATAKKVPVPTKPKVSVPKAKSVSSKPTAIAGEAKKPVKKGAVKKTASESGVQKKLPLTIDLTSDAEDAGKRKLEETGNQEAKSDEVGSCVVVPEETVDLTNVAEEAKELGKPATGGRMDIGKVETPTSAEALPENSAEKPGEMQPPTSTVEALSAGASAEPESTTQTPETETVGALPQIQKTTTSDPESTAPVPKAEAAGALPQIQKAIASEPELMTAGASPQLQKTTPSEQESTAPGPEMKIVEASPQIQQNTASKPESTPPGPETETAEASPQIQKTTTAEPEMMMMVEASPQIQKATASEPGSTTAQGPGSSQTEPPSAGEDDPVPEMKTETKGQSAGDASEVVGNASAVSTTSWKTEPQPEAQRQLQPAPATTPSPGNLTVGEFIEELLHPGKIQLHRTAPVWSKKLDKSKRVLLINRLPRYDSGVSYTEEELVAMLSRHGFEHKPASIFVIPQTGMAFVEMPSMKVLLRLMNTVGHDGVPFKGSTLTFHVVNGGIVMTTFGFYKSLMKQIKFTVSEDVSRTVLITNVSQSESQELREVLRNTCDIRNYLHLLNKVYIEFKEFCDADVIGVRYSFMKEAPGHNIYRLAIPGSNKTTKATFPKKVLLDDSLFMDGLVIPPKADHTPMGALAPFWIPLRTAPFLFPTAYSWFLIPDHLTIKGLPELTKAQSRARCRPTVMLTGLPGVAAYTHQDVAKLVWSFFPKPDIYSLYYSVMVLTLQRRAFVHFPDWASCNTFFKSCVKNWVYVRGYKLSIHLSLQDVHQASSEEEMYKNMMKWSNAGVLEPNSLEDRLLCVEISQTDTDVVGTVMEMVASVAAFVSFLPLANRICVEMADADGVTQVLEKYKTLSVDDEKKRKAWSKVQRIVNVKTLKQDLQDTEAAQIDLDTFDARYLPLIQSLKTPPRLIFELSDVESQTHEPVVVDPVASGPSSPATGDTATNQEGKTDTAVREKPVAGSTSAAEVTYVFPGNAGPATLASSSPSTSTPAPAGNPGAPEVPQMDTDAFRALTAAVRQHRLARESRSQSSEKKIPPRRDRGSRGRKKRQRLYHDFTDDTPAPGCVMFHEFSLNMEDFVTVDEVGDDTDEHRGSSSKSLSRDRRDDRSSKPAKDSRSTAASSSSSSSRSVRSPRSVTPKKSSEPAKSPSKLPPPASSSKTSSSSSSSFSSSSIKTPSSPAQKTRHSSTKSPSRTHSSDEQAKTTSAGTVKDITETDPEPGRGGEGKPTEGAVEKSDHKVSAEDCVAKTVESEANPEETTTQGRGLEPSQAPSPELKPEEPEKSKGMIVTDDPEERFHDLNTDHPTNELMDDRDPDSASKTQQTGTEDGRTVLGDDYQVLDSVTNDPTAAGEEESRLPMAVDSEALHDIDGDQTDNQVDEDNHNSTSGTGDTQSELHSDIPRNRRPYPDKADMDCSFRVLDSVTEDLTEQDGGSRVQQEDAGSPGVDAATDSVDEGQEMKDDNVTDGILPGGSSRDVENPEIPNESEPGNTDTPDDPEHDAPDQETFEILDSIDDQSTAEDESQKPETPKPPEPDLQPSHEEKDSYQVLDSAEDQARRAESETKEETVDGASRRSVPSTSASEGEERKTCPKKPERTVRGSSTRTKTDSGKTEAEPEYKILDSVDEQEPTTIERPSRRRSARGKKDDKKTMDLTEVAENPEPDTYQILDSVEDDTAEEEPAVATRSTRGRRERMTTRRRQTPEKTPTKKKKKEVSEEEASSEACDSVMDEVLRDPQPPTRGRGRRGRPKKAVRGAKKQSVAVKPEEAMEKPAGEEEEEEEATYRILDAVEDETVDDTDQAKTENTSRNADEEEEDEENPMYQIVDSVDDDQGQGESSKDETTEREKAPADEAAATEEALYEIVDAFDGNDDPSSGTGSKVGTSNEDPEREEEPKSPDTTSALVSLDEVSEEEEDYPDDTAEEEELRRRQASTKEKQLAKEQEATRRRSRSSSRGRRGGGGDNRGRTRRSKEMDGKEMVTLDEVGTDDGDAKKDAVEEKESLYEMVNSEEEEEQDGGERRRAKKSGPENEELVTLDEVGTDEAEEKKAAPERRGWHEEMTEGDLQTLVTLDEFVEEGDGEDEQSKPENQEEESADSFNPETLVTLDEAGTDEEKPDQDPARKTSKPAKRKHDEDAEESSNFVTVDEVGEEEEEKKKEAVGTTRTRGRAKKRTRQTPVRKSTRGKIETPTHETKEEESEPADSDAAPPTSLDASSSLDNDTSTLQSDSQSEVEREDAEDGGLSSRDAIKGVSKQRRDPEEPEAKRSRSQSPSVPNDFTLAPFKPHNPLGQEFIVPAVGFICNICSSFYKNESTAKEQHCSSRRHYSNLQKHYQKLQQEASRSSTQNSQGSVSE